jgi:cytochrome b561
VPLINSRAAYGWIAIGLHWISAVGVAALYWLGDGIEEAEGRGGAAAARDLHVSVGVLLFTFLLARVLWTLSQPKPAPLERNVWLRRLASLVHALFLGMIVVLIVTGPLAVWSAGRPIAVFGWFEIAGPWTGRIGWLHEALGAVHEAASKLFWPLIALHVGGALKHLLIDRDRTMARMLRPSRM